MALRDRYSESFAGPFESTIRRYLAPGVSILDVGSGRRPAIGVNERPKDCVYVGLDISREELLKASPGSYDEIVAVDVSEPVSSFDERFDLAVSFQVFEHVRDVSRAFVNLRNYLKPGGHPIAQFSGRFSVFGMLNQMVPQKLGLWLLENFHRREPGATFPAYYDRCWFSALENELKHWGEAQITCRYHGAAYFRFFWPIEQAYLFYEDWAERAQQKNLATHYLVVATK
jgi:SAM-dependent methyltransferase